MKHYKKKKLNRSRAGDAILLSFLLIAGTFSILPILFSVGQSFKPFTELFVMPPTLFPKSPTLEGYSLLFRITGGLWVPFSRYIFNSVLVSVSVTAAHVILVSMAAFPMAKMKFPGSRLLTTIIIISLMFTTQITAIMQYILIAKMGMVNTYWAMILPYIATPLGLFLMQQFMSQIPDAMIEAAHVDGASLMRICWKIAMPNVKPAVMTLIIFAFTNAWYVAGTNFIYTESLKTLPTIMSQISYGGIARMNVITAAAVIILLPPFVIFLIAQNNVLETMAHSGIKD